MVISEFFFVVVVVTLLIKPQPHLRHKDATTTRHRHDRPRQVIAAQKVRALYGSHYKNSNIVKLSHKNDVLCSRMYLFMIFFT